LKTKQAIEAIEGRTVNEALFDLYFVKFLTYRKICSAWNINNRTLMRLFAEYGFEPRKGSEAIKTQWIDANDRRILASNTLKNIVKSLPNPPAFGKQRPDSVIRMKTNNPMLNHETRIKSGNAIAKFYKENPTKHIIYHKKLTDNEQCVFDSFPKKELRVLAMSLLMEDLPIYSFLSLK